jgi:hypothetical protein
MNTPGGAVAFKIVFTVDSMKLGGTVKRTAGDVPLTGTFKADTVWFSYTIDYNGNPLELSVTAKLKGDSLTGIVDMGGVAQDAFSAHRTPRAPSALPLRKAHGVVQPPNQRQQLLEFPLEQRR